MVYSGESYRNAQVKAQSSTGNGGVENSKARQRFGIVLLARRRDEFFGVKVGGCKSGRLVVLKKT